MYCIMKSNVEIKNILIPFDNKLLTELLLTHGTRKDAETLKVCESKFEAFESLCGYISCIYDADYTSCHAIVYYVVETNGCGDNSRFDVLRYATFPRYNKSVLRTFIE